MAKEYTRMLGAFAGIDVTSDDSTVDVSRMPYAVNMWRDWESENGAAIETIPGWRQIRWQMNGAKIHSLWTAKFNADGVMDDYLIIHSGDTLFAYPVSKRDAEASIYTIGTVADADSNGFAFGESFYVLDGSDIWKIGCQSGEGNVSFSLTQLGDTEDAEGLKTESYIPTTYSDGVEYEQRNMLTNFFYNAYNIQKPEEMKWYNGLHLEVISDTEKTLKVTGVHYGITHIYVPSEVTWNGELYKITTLEERAFAYNSRIESVVLSKGIKEIKTGTFSECYGLKTFIAHGVQTIEEMAFNLCTKLERVVLSKDIETIAPTAFFRCNSKAHYYCEGDSVSGLPGGAALNTGVIVIEAKVGEEFRVPLNTTKYTRTKKLQNYVLDAVEQTDKYEIETDDNQTETGVVFQAKKKTSWLGILFGFEGANTEDYKILIVTVTEDGTAVSSKESQINSYRFDILDPCKDVVEVTLNGRNIPSEPKPGDYNPNDPTMEEPKTPLYYLLGEELNEKTYLRAVVITISENELLGQKLQIKGIAYDSEFSRSEAGNDYTYESSGYKGTSVEAIRKCTIAAEFDGRIFLTGNPQLPNTVFYSHRNLHGVNDPTYFGQLNYFNDGTGMNPNKSLLSTPSFLAVIKADSTGSGAIYYHTPSETEYDIMPKIYPGVQGSAGVGSLGPCLNFRDDPVFISKMGLEGISLSALNAERGLYHRSSNIDKWLLKHKDLSVAKMCEWKGYLVILVGGEIFLADSRQLFKHPIGGVQYEWYFLDDVGEYVGQTDQYFFPSASPIDAEGRKYTDFYHNGIRFEVKEEESLFDGEWKSANPSFNAEGTAGTSEINIKYAEEIDEQGVTHYYILDSYGEKIGGTFSRATALAECDGVLCYGTENGNLFCFNSDKRGEAYVREHYTEPVPEDQIHRSWYNRNGRRYLSGFATKKDNCGVPQYDKDTCRRSLVVKGKTITGSKYSIKVRTDREPWEFIENHTLTEATSFDYDFQNTSFLASGEMISPSRESKRRWVEKQYYLYSDGYCRPFGIYYLTYRYKISGMAGRIRRG